MAAPKKGAPAKKAPPVAEGSSKETAMDKKMGVMMGKSAAKTAPAKGKKPMPPWLKKGKSDGLHQEVV